LTEWAAYKPVRRSGRLAALLTAIGVSFLLQSLFGLATQARVLSYQGGADELAHRPIGVGAGGVTAIELAYLPLSLLLALGLWLLVMKTRFGRAMRAVSQDADAAAAMGVNLDRLIRWTFVLAGLLAGVAGTLYALLNGLTPTMGFRPGILAFIAAVVGGIGSLPGTLAGGFLIGLLAGAVDCFGVPSAYRDVAAFGLLIIFLVARPQGLLGPQEQEKV
jgi:branched-chain amino acid transport system permease protein